MQGLRNPFAHFLDIDGERDMAALKALLVSIFQMHIQKIQHPGYIFLRFKPYVRMFRTFKQFQYHPCISKHLFQLYCKFDGLLDRHDRVFRPML